MISTNSELRLGAETASSVVEAALNRAPASLGPRRTNSPHEFYRYPARFPADLARAIIGALTSPGDIVLDPFVGGGTTLVESRLTGRIGVGCDLNQLATFVTRVKCTVQSDDTLEAVLRWADTRLPLLKLSRPAEASDDWIEKGYLRNVDGRDVWRLRKVIAMLRVEVDELTAEPQRAFVRCVLLRTAQWAFDMRLRLPTVSEFRQAFATNLSGMVDAAREYARHVRRMDRSVPTSHPRRTIVIDGPAQALPSNARVVAIGAPQLVLTSPPYPGVYVNYHRWKLRSRLETPVPYWIADQLDGHGLAYYTMNARSNKAGDLSAYFLELSSAFSAIAAICDRETVIAQVVGFSKPRSQVSAYLKVMEEAGFREALVPGCATAEDGRLWRNVPGRRWWTHTNGKATAREVVLFHRLHRKSVPTRRA